MKTMKEELEKVLDEKRQQVAEIKDNYVSYKENIST